MAGLRVVWGTAPSLRGRDHHYSTSSSRDLDCVIVSLRMKVPGVAGVGVSSRDSR